MPADSACRFTKFRWVCTLIGIGFYIFDIGTDLFLFVTYLTDGHFLWSGLTVLFVVVGSLCCQIFSYAWFKDDEDMDTSRTEHNKLSKIHLVGLHLIQMGVFTRYYQLLVRSAKSIRSKFPERISENQEHYVLFAMAADLSMLRLFETFLESVPQLILQLYIILGRGHGSFIQYISMALSFLNIAWSTVDYRRCFRRTLPHLKEMPSGFPTVVYLLYKIFTITMRIISITLFIVVNSLSLLGLAFIWLLGTIWACVVDTNFCESTKLEILYRGVVGVILTFTFFNVKGQNTKLPMTVYYVLYILQNVSAPVVLFAFNSETEYFSAVTITIVLLNILGLVFLGFYYSLLHPRDSGRIADELDALDKSETKIETRYYRFLQM
ncbi:XK-related protein 9 [Chanos chanos]|uniref:XK-related protein n=1 Tax=Chanos chanos TaxID=29144 RepID=A0A6J2UTL9_CHACN|nr:XK-related protein 9 [Chanos chanos]